MSAERSYDVNIGAYLAALRRQIWLIAASTAVGLLLGLAYAAITPPTYVSTATVEVKPLGTQPDQIIDQRSLGTLVSTEKQVATSTRVAEIAGEDLGSQQGPDALLSHLFVATPGDTNVLSFSYSSGDPIGARDGAQAFADAYVELKQRQAVATYQTLRQTIRMQIRNTMQRISKVSSKIVSSTVAAEPGSPARTLRTSLVTKLGQLWGESAALAPIVVDPAHVVQGAEIPPGPNSPARSVDIAVGALLALVAGCGVALLRNRRGGRWRGAVDLEQQVGAPLIGMIPKIGRSAKNNGTLITLGDRTPVSEAYRQLRAHVLALGARGVKTIAITSPIPDEGKSTTAVNLAVTLARAGKRTILVSGDIRASGVDRAFDLHPHRGLSSVLSGTSPLGETLRSSGIQDLWVLPSGDAQDDGSDVVRPDAVERLLRARDLVDFIIVDCPPLFAVSDSLTFASQVDGVVLVAHARRSRRGQIERARDELHQLQARLVGIVVNEVPASLAPGYEGYARLRRNGSTGRTGAPQFSTDHLRASTSDDAPPIQIDSAEAWLHRPQRPDERRTI